MIGNGQAVETTFQLRPCTPGELTETLAVSGYLARKADTLMVKYRVHGTLKNIKHPAALPFSPRLHELWRHTCFELFIGSKGESGYLEVNVSPSGAWNVYHFSDYRKGMREDRSVGQPLFRVATGDDFLSLSCSISLNTVIDDAATIEVGVSSVIETVDGALSYWAVVHPGSEPDFHDRRTFLITLPGSGEPDG